MPVAYPLDDFYAQAGLPLPPISLVESDQVPEPQRSLLVHQNDMTPTLQAFYGGLIHIRVLRSSLRGDQYFREVVLHLDGSDRAVEFGAIKIYLHLIPAGARRLILEEQLPLGRILKECEVQHLSRPKAFLKVQSDELINRALGLEQRHTLYGRRNTLTDPQLRPLAEIVEILPPA